MQMRVLCLVDFLLFGVAEGRAAQLFLFIYSVLGDFLLQEFEC